MEEARATAEYANALWKKKHYRSACRCYWKALLLTGECGCLNDTKAVNLLLKCQDKCSVLLEEDPAKEEEEEEVDKKFLASISTLNKMQYDLYHSILHLVRKELVRRADHYTPKLGDAEMRRFVTFPDSTGRFVKHKLARFFSWVIPGYLAGISIPRNQEDVRALEALGVKLVVTVIEESPLPREWFNGTQMQNVFYPVRNQYPPSVEEVDAFFKEVEEMTYSSQETRKPVAIAVHCGGGVGRAGTFLACYLMRYGTTIMGPFCDSCRGVAARLNRAVRSSKCYGECANADAPRMTAAEAINLLRVGRPGSLETQRQEEFVKKYNGVLWSRHLKPGIDEDKTEDATADLPLSWSGKSVTNPSFVVLCGLQGSGKSWFADKLVSNSDGKFVRVCQDVVGSVEGCERMVYNYTKHLGAANSPRVILDRCNPTAAERKKWLEIAFKPRDAVAVYFSATSDVCKERIRNRFGHETIRAGGGKYALASMAKQMEPPTLGEGFSAIYCVHNFQNAEALVEKWTGKGKEDEKGKGKVIEEKGVEKEKGKETIENVTFDPGTCTKSSSNGASNSGVSSNTSVTTACVKFPRTPHFFNTGGTSVSSDDVVADTGLALQLLMDKNVKISVEEKVDGANMGLSLDRNYKIVVQNRSHFINFKEQKQYELLPNWITERTTRLMHLLGNEPNKRILYGEWVVAKHSIHYTNLPDYFLAFDIWDVEQSKFYSRDKFRREIEEANALADVYEPLICSVPEIRGVDWSSLNTKEKWKQVLMEKTSAYRDGPLEGLYIRVDKGDHLRERMKLVSPDFIAGSENWSKFKITKNIVNFAEF